MEVSMKKDNNQISFFFFMFSLGCVLTFIILDLIFYSYNIKTHLMTTATKIAQQKQEQLLTSISSTKNILNAIQSSKPFHIYLQKPQNHQKTLQDIFLLITKQDPNIMQLRYIDKKGQEQVRVDRPQLHTPPFVIQGNKLQNKAQRYYFKDSINKPSKVWYSNLDLNIEHGKVEIPYKPTFRAMLPIQEHDSFQGLLIINYHMQTILNDLVNNPSHDIIIANKRGYPLIHFQEEKSWGFYQSPQITIEQSMPEVFQKLQTIDDLFANKTFVIQKIHLDLEEALYIILQPNQNYLEELSKERLMHYLLVSIIILVLSILMSGLFSNYIKRIFVVLRDAKTLNKLLNKKVKEQTSEISKSKKQLDDIITTINDFVWEVNSQAEFTYLSPQVKNILGYRPEELLGKSMFTLISKKDRQKIEYLYHNHFRYAKPIIQLKSTNLHRQGHIVYLEISANPILNKHHQVIGYRGSNRDITQKVNSQKIIEENYKKIDQLNTDLKGQVKEEVRKNIEKDMQLFAQSKMAAMGDMIANIAHQWRQPLSAISTTASGVKLKKEYEQLTDEEIINSMDTIVNKTQYLSQTIDTFMSFLKEKKIFKDVSLKKTLHQPIQMVRSALENHFITLDTNLEEIDDLTIKTVPTELQEVIINILNNAKDALKEHRKDKRHIKLTVKVKKSTLYIIIEDNAGGIPLQIIDRIFEPYFTTKHESVGTGLGLHMSYRVITESLQGKIYAKNGKEGAIFYIELPL